MQNDKHVSNSNDRVDLTRDSIESAGSEGTENSDPPGANKNSETLSRIVSRLQTIRVPGHGRVNAEEIIAVAIDQANEFQRWRDDGAQVGEMELWVEGTRVMSALPEPPAKLQEVKFRVPSSNTAVLQVTTQTRGERTVLYNLLLRDVPANGLLHEEKWPNGQSMSLHITRNMSAMAAVAHSSSRSQALDEFSIRVAINPHEMETECQTSAHGAHNGLRKRSIADERRVPVNKKKSRVMAAGAGSSLGAIAILILSLAVPIALLGERNATATHAQEERAAFQSPAAYSPTGNIAIPNDGSVLINPIESGAATSRWKTDGLASVSSANEGKSNGLPPLGASANANRVATTVDSKLGMHAASDAWIGRVSSSWETTVFPRLAAMKNMYVKMGSQPERAQLKGVFIRALEASAQFNVVSERDQRKADGVLTLSFEHPSPCVGVVFVKLTDADGKFLWQDYAWEAPKVCLTIPSSRERMFDDASTALVDSLENTVRHAQETTKGREPSADGG